MLMRKLILSAIIICSFSGIANAQFTLDKAIGAASKGAKALSFTNEDAKKLSKEGVDYMDKNNKIASAKSPYTVRLNKLFGKHKNQDGLNLNYKVYEVSDINAFACADGSVRVFSGLMDIMDDN